MKKIILYITVFLLYGAFILSSLGYVLIFNEKKLYLKPFMSFEDNIGRKGEYSSVMYKTFDPALWTFIGIVPASQQIDAQTIFKYQARIKIFDMKNSALCFEGPFVPSHTVFRLNNKSFYGIPVANKYIPNGKYTVEINNQKDYPELANVKFNVVAYPVTEFLGILSAILLTLMTVSFVLLSLLSWYFWKRWSLTKKQTKLNLFEPKFK